MRSDPMESNISGFPPRPIKRELVNPAGIVAGWRVSPRRGGGFRKRYGPVAGNTSGAAIRRRTSPVAACRGRTGRRPRRGGGGRVAASSSSSVVVWLVAGPGVLEAELEIGRLRRRRGGQGRRTRAQAQAVEDCPRDLWLIDRRQDSHSPAAVTLECVHGEHAAQELRPRESPRAERCRAERVAPLARWYRGPLGSLLGGGWCGSADG